MTEPMPQGNNTNNAYAGDPGPAPTAGPVLPKRPKHVDSSFGLQMLTLVLTAINIPLGLATVNSADNRAAMQAEYEGTGLVLDVDAAVAMASIFVVAIGLVCIAINLLTALFTRKGYNWARILLAVYAVATALSLITQTNVMGWWGVLAIVIATVLLFRKPSPEYFREMKQYRQNKKFGQGYTPVAP